MASSFVFGDTFREGVMNLLEKGSMPGDLQDELESLLKQEQPFVLPFSTARKLHRYLKDNGMA